MNTEQRLTKCELIIENLEKRIEALEIENEEINQELAEREFGHSKNKPKAKFSRDMKVQEYAGVYYNDIKKKYPGKLKMSLQQVEDYALSSAKFMQIYQKWVNGAEDRPTLYLNKAMGVVQVGSLEEWKKSQAS